MIGVVFSVVAENVFVLSYPKEIVLLLIFEWINTFVEICVSFEVLFSFRLFVEIISWVDIPLLENEPIVEFWFVKGAEIWVLIKPFNELVDDKACWVERPPVDSVDS